MRRSTALNLLPATHRRVLVLVDQGLDSAKLASHLGLDTSAIGPLLRVARAKLAALEALDEPADGADADGHTTKPLTRHRMGGTS